jgi:hypothetical protein
MLTAIAIDPIESEIRARLRRMAEDAVAIIHLSIEKGSSRADAIESIVAALKDTLRVPSAAHE